MDSGEGLIVIFKYIRNTNSVVFFGQSYQQKIVSSFVRYIALHMFELTIRQDYPKWPWLVVTQRPKRSQDHQIGQDNPKLPWLVVI